MDTRTRDEVELEDSMTPLDSDRRGYDRLLHAIGDARFVLLGEASHGTHEFYRERAAITRRLIEDKGFDAVAIEADWPPVTRVHQFIQSGGESDPAAEVALADFERFPKWMWRNTVIADLSRWTAAHAPHVGFYGLDLYSLHESIDAIVTHLDEHDPEAAKRARARYSCFEHFGADTSAYAYASGLGLAPTCEAEVAQQLVEMQSRALEMAARRLASTDDLDFQLEMNARLVKAAEEYYRNMLRGSVVTWNLRDRHMADTLAAIAQHLDHRLGRPCKIAVWEHNSHLGDARATEMGWQGELNVGQLVRERWGRDSFLVGFTTYDGTVTATNDWGSPGVVMKVRPALHGSHEELLHRAASHLGVRDAIVLPAQSPDRALPRVLKKERLERAIGVVYRPKTERQSHWFHARLADQFDAVIHIDRSSAVCPLDPSEREPLKGELPDTYPTSL